MFYSHQLLARKAPLGQIWMAATVHAKINRRKLDKLDIVKVCEEILNPSVPMALRLSGILMGGVVIVYDRKVKLLYDDVTRLLVQINAAWKVKAVSDPTVLPKAKAQAKFEAVTLPEYADLEAEQSMVPSYDAAPTTARFQHMRMDDLDEHYYINFDIRDDDLIETHHRADAENITLFEDFGSEFEHSKLYNHFERFDIGDDDTQTNITSQEQPQFENSLRPSPQPEEVDRNFTFYQHTTLDNPGIEEEEQKAKMFLSDEDIQRVQPVKRKARRRPNYLIMDNEQLMVPGNIYQSWLQDTSDIASKRGRTVKQCLQSLNPFRSTKLSILLDLPPVVLVSGLDKLPAEIHYPAPLMELWRKCTQVKSANTSPTGDNSPPAQQQVAPEMFPEEIHGDIESNELEFSIEKTRANLENLKFQGIFDAFGSDHFATPGSPAGQRSRSIPSSSSGNNIPMPLLPEIQLHSGRSKRKQNSSSNFGNLDPVEEELSLQQEVRGLKIRRLSENDPNPDSDFNELLVETGPTQTPIPPPGTSADQTTELIRTHLKLHFDSPGAPPYESLNQLAFGMNKKRAAQLFYQTCVLATFDYIKVEQHEPHGDIAISRGPKM